MQDSSTGPIADDILLATSTFFQDGVAAQAVNEVTAQGITFVIAAGNNGDRACESLSLRPMGDSVN